MNLFPHLLLFSVQDDVSNDAFLSGPCCVPCSNCQVTREMKARGAWE